MIFVNITSTMKVILFRLLVVCGTIFAILSLILLFNKIFVRGENSTRLSILAPFKDSSETSTNKKSDSYLSTENWNTFSSKSSGIFEGISKDFSFKYPPDFILDYADGPNSSGAIISSQSFELDVSIRTPFDWSENKAADFIKGIINREPGSLNCDILPTCDEKAFSVRKEELRNGLIADVASGPAGQEEVFDNYFITSINGGAVSMYFTFEDTDYLQNIKRQILSTLVFE